MPDRNAKYARSSRRRVLRAAQRQERSQTIMRRAAARVADTDPERYA